jgi:hypothetical protein
MLDLPDRGHRRLLLVLFGTFVVAGLCILLIPVLVLRPFRYESPRSLWLAMATHQHAPLVTFLFAVIVSVLTLMCWAGSGRWQKLVLALGVLSLVAAAVLVRINYFERMFHPVVSDNFEPASQIKLDSTEMVMAVHLGDEARAYPIRAMAYHHLVNDVIADWAIVVTY